jgi:hypothetical protein
VVSLVYSRISVEPCVDHDAVDEIVHYGSDAVDPAQPVIE